MTRRQLAFLVAAGLLLAQACLAQRASNWRVFKLSDGLPESACSSVTVGAQGKVLVTHPSFPLITELDGYTCTNMSAPRPGLSRCYGSPAGQLWTIFGDALQEFRDGQWTLHRPKELGIGDASKPGSSLMHAPLLPVRQGRVVLLLPDRLIQFSSESGDRGRVEVLRSAPESGLGSFLAMSLSRDGGLWIAGERGLGKLQGPLRALTAENDWREYRPPKTLAADHFREPHEDAQGAVTLAAQSSTNGEEFLAVTFAGHEWTKTRIGNEKLSLAWRTPDEKVWAITPEALLQGDPQRPDLAEDNDLPARRYVDAAIEPGGAFWLATGEGLFRYAPLCWQSPVFPRDPAAPVRFLSGDQDGRLWFLARNALYLAQGDRQQEFAFPAALSRSLQNASGIYPLKNGTLAIAAGPQLFQFDPANGAFKAVPGFENGVQVRVVGQVKDGVLALQSLDPNSAGGPARELQVFDGVSLRTFPSPLPDPSVGDTVSSVFAAQNGDLWLSAELGIALLHDKKWRCFPSVDKSAPDQAVAFAELPDGKIWCAVPDRIWEFDGKNWLDLRRGFDHINALLQTRDGSLWVASNSGLFRFFQGAWVENGVEEGLPSIAINDLWEDKQDRLWAATSQGLGLYHPKADPDPPRTSLEALRDNEKNVPEGGAITITFSALDKWRFTPRPRLLFSSRLDGRDWSAYQEASSVSFADLPPGKHYFQVRAMDRNCNVDPKPAALEFSVVVPWYREARLVVISSLGAVAALFFAAVAFNRHRRLLRSYAEVEKKIAQRTRELEIANRELLHSQKMNALGTLAAGIAHDFNNILSIIEGSTQIIEENIENPQKVRTRLARIKTVVEQGAGIVKAMLGFSRESTQPAGPCDLVATVQDTLKLLGDRFLREVRVTFEPAADLPLVLGFRDFIQQILLNLIFNAAESMSASRDIVIACRRCENLPQNLALAPGSASAYACISVQDFGSGIEPGNLARIFEPFFTTKAMSAKRGTGLGLSMVYELAKKMAAGLAVESTVGQGSVFTLILPVIPNA